MFPPTLPSFSANATYKAQIPHIDRDTLIVKSKEVDLLEELDDVGLGCSLQYLYRIGRAFETVAQYSDDGHNNTAEGELLEKADGFSLTTVQILALREACHTFSLRSALRRSPRLPKEAGHG